VIVVSFAGRRAGGMLAFRLTKALLAHAGDSQAKLPDEVLPSKGAKNSLNRWTDGRLEKLLEATRGSRVVIKTNAPPDGLTAGALFRALETGELKIHVVYRDPRGAVSSMLGHDAGSLREINDVEAALVVLRADLTKLRHWGAFPSLKLCYDDLRRDPAQGVQQIADDLGVTVDAAAVVDRVMGEQDQAASEPELSVEDAARVQAAVPNYLRLVEERDLSWFQRVG
jgi:hypothetical protein